MHESKIPKGRSTERPFGVRTANALVLVHCDPTGWLSELFEHRASIQHAIDELEDLLMLPANDNEPGELADAA